MNDASQVLNTSIPPIIVYMKKAVFFLFLCLLLPFAFAACDEDQRIFRISKDVGGHVALYTGTYPVEICYNDIFGEPYELPNPHDCIAGSENLVLVASGATNAHVAQPNLIPPNPAYSGNICFGDLECTYVGACAVGEECIATISAVANASVSKFCEGAGSFPIKVCCQSESVIPGSLDLISLEIVIQPQYIPSNQDFTPETAKIVLRNLGSTEATVDLAANLVDAVNRVEAIGDLEQNNIVIQPGAEVSVPINNWLAVTSLPLPVQNYSLTARAFDSTSEALVASGSVIFGVLNAGGAVPVPELNVLLLPLIAFSVIAFALFSKKNLKK